MIRTIAGVLLLILSVLWLPLWVQLVLLAAFILTDRNPGYALIPAVISDALYAPGSIFELGHHLMILAVLAALLIRYVVVRKLRVHTDYGLEA